MPNGEYEDDEYDDEELERVIDPRADTSPELTLAMTRPAVAKKHSRFVSRDLAVTFIPKNKPEYIDIVSKYVSIIMDFDFLHTKKYPTMIMADNYNSEMKAKINLWRSIEGFERKQHGTTRRIREDILKGGKKSRWELRK